MFSKQVSIPPGQNLNSGSMIWIIFVYLHKLENMENHLLHGKRRTISFCGPNTAVCLSQRVSNE